MHHFNQNIITSNRDPLQTRSLTRQKEKQINSNFWTFQDVRPQKKEKKKNNSGYFHRKTQNYREYELFNSERLEAIADSSTNIT
jgi:hypothetical protein